VQRLRSTPDCNKTAQNATYGSMLRDILYKVDEGILYDVITRNVQ
jgi:hypothetical protein